MLCILIGTFKLFTFKVIIDRYAFIAILFLIIFLWLFFLFLLLKARSLTFVAILVWWQQIPLHLSCLRSSLFLLQW